MASGHLERASPRKSRMVCQAAPAADEVGEGDKPLTEPEEEELESPRRRPWVVEKGKAALVVEKGKAALVVESSSRHSRPIASRLANKGKATAAEVERGKSATVVEELVESSRKRSRQVSFCFAHKVPTEGIKAAATKVADVATVVGGKKSDAKMSMADLEHFNLLKNLNAGSRRLLLPHVYEVNVHSAPPYELVKGKKHAPGGKQRFYYFHSHPAPGKRSKRCRRVDGGGIWRLENRTAILNADKSILLLKRMLSYMLIVSSGVRRRTGWCMLEFSLENQHNDVDEMVLCIIYRSNRSYPEIPTAASSSPGTEITWIEQGCDVAEEDGVTIHESLGSPGQAIEAAVSSDNLNERGLDKLIISVNHDHPEVPSCLDRRPDETQSQLSLLSNNGYWARMATGAIPEGEDGGTSMLLRGNKVGDSAVPTVAPLDVELLQLNELNEFLLAPIQVEAEEHHTDLDRRPDNDMIAEFTVPPLDVANYPQIQNEIEYYLRIPIEFDENCTREVEAHHQQKQNQGLADEGVGGSEPGNALNDTGVLPVTEEDAGQGYNISSQVLPFVDELFPMEWDPTDYGQHTLLSEVRPLHLHDDSLDDLTSLANFHTLW